MGIKKQTKRIGVQPCAPNPFLADIIVNDIAVNNGKTSAGKRMDRTGRFLSLAFMTLKSALLIYVMSFATLALSQSTPACLYVLDPSAQGAFAISGTTSVSASCSAVVESSASQAFQMSGTETLSLSNNSQVGVVGGWQISGQSKIVNQSTGQTIQPVTITSPGDPLAFLPAPTQGTIVSQSHASYDMNNRPPNNTLSPGVYCGGLTIGNTNGATFTMNPGTYIMAGGGLTINSQAIVKGTGVTVYNTSSSGWGCSASSSYTPITISGQAAVTMSAPTSGALAGVLLFGNRTGCATVGSCQDQVNGGGSTTFSGAIYLKSDTLLFSGNHSSSGCMLSVADKININGNSSFVINGCSGPLGGVSVSVAPTTATIHAGQTQQFSATVTNASSTAVSWSISPAGVGTISAAGLYTAPTSVSSQQTVTVNATSQVDASASASATITLLPAVPPSITASATPAPNSQGWNNSNVTVTFTCVAGSSPIQTCPSPVTVSTEGANQSVSGTVTDTAGKTATASVTINLDKTPPTITAVVTPTPVGGVNFGSATVTFTCTDGLSGVASCPSPVTKTTIGSGQVVTGTATDKAGNSNSASVTLNIQTVVGPTITASLAPAPNAAGWNNSNVTVTFTCTPGSYAIQTCPAPVVVSTEGANQQVSGTVVDASGATASTSVSVNLDETPPTITGVVTPTPAGGINFGSATVTFICTDGLSGVASCPAPVTKTTIGSGQVVTGTATDKAGNSNSASVTLNIQAVVGPSIAAVLSPAPNAAGWNNSNVTVTFTCTAGSYAIQTCPSPVVVSTEGANQPVSGTVVDASGATASASVSVNLDKTPPTITASISPQPNANGIIAAPPATITFTCSDALSGVANCPSPITVTTFGLNQNFSGTATDVAGNTATATATVSIMAAVPPTISFVASPAANSAGWNNSDVTVTFTCSPGTNAIASCSPPETVSTEGANQKICGNVVDSAGVSASACATINLDKTPPVITAATAPPAVNGWNTSLVTVTFTCSDALSGIATCPSPQNISVNGMGQVITGTAVDVAGNNANAEVTLNIDQIPPTILQFTAPSQLAPGQSGTATVTATDNIDVASVVIQLNGNTIATLNAAPYTTTFDAPSDATSGSTLTLTAQVIDVAGNVSTSSREIQVVSSGVVTGQVLSDVTSLPLPGASVQVIGGTASDVSDANGRYSIASNASHLFLSFNVAADPATGTPAMVGVEREVFLQNGVGTVPVDARMTPVAAPVSINAAGGSLVSGPLNVTVVPGAVPSATNFYLTQLSEEGLPELLPLGWSPITAFDLRSDSSTSSSFDASFSQLPTSLILHLVRYDSPSHAWVMVTPNLTSVDGTLSASIPSLGDFALVTADAGSTVPIPVASQPLTGVSMVMLPAGAIASGTLNPPSISPSGGTSVATLAVQSSVPLPSGTVIQANVQETYALASGKQLSSAKRSEDIVVYQYAAPTGAAAVSVFPVTPSQTFQPEVFSSGNVHLDILSGRESARGQVGGSDAVTVTGGDATLTIAAGSLTQDTAIAVSPETVDTFLPSTATLVPLSEYNMDFSGETLVSPAQLSVAAGAAQPGDNVLLAQIQRVNGVPYLVVVSLAQVSGSNLITQAVPGLAGITQSGDYVFYKVTSPTGYVSGTVTGPSGAIAAMVQSDGLPFVAFSNVSGSYVIPTPTGTVNLTASVPNTALSGSAQAQVTAGQTTTVNLTLSGQTEAATITPANGAVGVPLTAEIDITAADPINQSTVTASTVVLTQSGGANVPVRFVFAQNGTRLSVFPVSALQPSTSYTLAASGLATTLGGFIAVPSITFTTQAITPPNFNTNALVFSMPDQNGNVQISAPASSFPPGTTVLIVDQTNGVVLSLTVGNDGSVSGQMPATIDDVLAVTITAPDKTTTSFTISKYVAADGTTAIGSGGGTVTGPDNLGMIIPQGALNKGTTFKLDLLDQTAFTQLPTWQNLNFGSGMQITAPAMPSFNKEVKLAFPVPENAPQGASYYVFRILTDQNNNVLFETIDQAFVQGTGANAQVVTASPPFCGYMNSYGNFQAAASASFSPIATAIVKTFMMWDFDPNQPGVSSTGLIVGKIFQTPSGSTPSFSPLVAPVSISLTNNPQYVTTSDPNCGTYSLFDPQRGGGTRSVTATYQATGQTIVASASEVNGIQVNDTDYDVTAGLEAQYQNIGRLNFTFAPPTPPPPPPQLNIRLYTLDGNGHRVQVSGILQTGTNIVIAFQSKLTIESASIGTTQLSVETPDSAENAITDNLPEQHLLNARVQGLQALSSPGTYVIAATALDPVTLTQVSGSVSVLVVAAGGGNNTAFTCSPPVTSCKLPSVIDSSPINGATGVSPSVFPQITFDEPVKQVTTENVVLRDSTGTSVPIQLIGTKSDGTIANPVQPGDAITALTIEPANGLQFSQTYTLTLNAKENSTGCIDGNGNISTLGSDGSQLIVDTNTSPNGPLCLPQFPVIPKTGVVLPYTFTTFGPQDLGGVISQYPVTTRPAIIGQYAYAGENISSAVGALGMFDISDPSNPKDLGVGASFIGATVDIAGEAQSPVTGGPLVAISSGMAVDNTIPANVWLYDVSTPTKPVRVGAVSVSSSAMQAGIALRLFMKDQFLYASTFLQGLQVIDLSQAIPEYQQVFNTNPTQFGAAVTTEGDGFAMDTIVNTIQLPTTTGGTATMFDLKADDFTVASGGTQTLIAATGQLPLVLADPTLTGSSAVLYPTPTGGNFSLNPVQPLLLTSADGKTNSLLCSGRAVALASLPFTDNSGNSTTKHIAVVVGTGATGPASTTSSCSASGIPALMVVDLSAVYSQGSPFTPQPMGFLQLPTTPTDVSINGTVALVATGSNVVLVNLENPAQPVLGGQITGNFGNWLTTNSSGLIVGSSVSPSSGVQVSSLGVVPIITVDPTGLVATEDGLTSEDIPINYGISGDLSQVTSAKINVVDDTGTVVFSTPVPVRTSGSVTWPAGQPIHVTPSNISFTVQNPDGSSSQPAQATSETDTGASPTPVIESASPTRIVVGSSQDTLDIIGRNFLISTQASFVPTGTAAGSTTALPIQFVSSTEVKLSLAASYFANTSTWTLSLFNSGVESNEISVVVVPAGLPPAPVLNSINPSQLLVNQDAEDATITLNGANFMAGDTIVRASFEDPNVTPELQVQVISPTQIQVVIPSEWQLSPMALLLYAQSSQDSALSSNGVEFDIVDPNATTAIEVPTPLDPQYSPVTSWPSSISSVNDGFVVLATGTSQSSSVALQGTGFQTGATVVADVDGVQTTLVPSSVTSSQIQLQVPSDVFGLKNYTFVVQLQLASAPANQTPPQAQQQAPATRGSFENQSKYANTSSPSFNLGGFHKRNTHASPSKPDDYFLMVPEPTPARSQNATNSVIFALPKGLLGSSQQITFDADLPNVASAQPPSITQVPKHSKQPLTVKSAGIDQSSPTNLTVNLSNTSPANSPRSSVGTLGLQIMKARVYGVNLYFVTGKVQDNWSSSQDCTNLNLAPKRLKNWQKNYVQQASNLAGEINNIWGPQANVQFQVSVVPNSQGASLCKGNLTPWPVDYDQNKDKALRISPANPDKNGEEQAIISAIPAPAPTSGQDGAINIYFVQSFGSSMVLNTLPTFPPAVNPTISTSPYANVPFSALFGVTGGQAPYTWTATGLPSGWTQTTNSDGTFSISGTPTQAGNITFLLEVKDSDTNDSQGPQDIKGNFTFPVAAAPANPPKSVGPNKKATPLPSGGSVAGFSTQLGGLGIIPQSKNSLFPTSIFVDDVGTPQDVIAHVIAHELGHAQGLNHMSEHPNPDPNTPTTCTNISGLTSADDDFKDPTALMWWATYRPPIPSKEFSHPNQSHIGIRNWWQLVGITPVGTGCR